MWRMASTPDVLYRAIRDLARRRFFMRFGRDFDGSRAKLRQISIKITNACNLRCKMCAQWGESGYNLGKPTEAIRETVPLDAYRRMVDDVAGIKPHIYIWGGEPFLYKDLMPLVGYMKEKDFSLAVVTNGTRLEEHAAEIVNTGWDAVMLSLDGPPAVHDEIRGMPGCFDVLAKGIDKLNRTKAERRKRKPHIMILATVSRDNAAVLDEIFDAAEELGAGCVIVYYSWFTTEEIGLRHQGIMRSALGCEATAWKGYLLPVDGIDVGAVQESARRIRAKKYSFPYLFLPELTIEEIPRYYVEPENFFGYDKCVAPWLVAEVMPEGSVATCRDYPDYVAGNIKEQGILDIFHGERYWRFRNALREHGMFPICARCCGLMGF
jgi:MoaA/NifB/PqqE/SkfB family radical SAM enzyme